MSDEPPAIERRARARVGTTLRGKWRLDRLLGVGGMAAVYAATHRNGKRGAVKMLHHELSVDADVRARFLREGYVANKVDHPGAVSVLDDDVCEDGSVFLVMDLLEGRSLEAMRRDRPSGRFTADEVASMTVPLLEALECAHAKGVIHRDLKPDNLFVTSSGLIKILDFGIARLREGPGTGHATRTGMAMGTPVFMPPEQALGNWDQVDQRTDLWAVGATMFTLLTGRVVHEADTVNKQLLAAMTAKARPIAEVEPGVPDWIGAIVDRALAFDRADRWPSAAAMRQALTAAVEAGTARWVSVATLASVSPAMIARSDAGAADRVAVAAQPAAPGQQREPNLAPGASPFLPDQGTSAPVSSDPGYDPPTRKMPARHFKRAAIAIVIGLIAGLAVVWGMVAMWGRKQPTVAAYSAPESVQINASASYSPAVDAAPAPSQGSAIPIEALPRASGATSSKSPDRGKGTKVPAPRTPDPLDKY